MPRAGLDPDAVVAAAAALADEVGFANLTMALLAGRLGVRTPSLYKHVASQDDLTRRIAALVAREVADVMGTAVQGRTGRDALAAVAHAFRAYLAAHPGRYAATVGIEPTGPDDPVAGPDSRVMGSFRAVLRSYPVSAADTDHALRALRSFFHGFATLEAGRGFRWDVDVDESFEWLIDLLHRGLSTAAERTGTTPAQP